MSEDINDLLRIDYFQRKEKRFVCIRILIRCILHRCEQIKLWSTKFNYNNNTNYNYILFLESIRIGKKVVFNWHISGYNNINLKHTGLLHDFAPIFTVISIVCSS